MRYLLTTLLLLIPLASTAEVIEEIVVTGSYAESSPPAQRVVRKADNLLLRVIITNDAREEAQREKEIHRTLLNAINAAKKVKNIELSSVSENGFVLPLQQSNHRIELSDGSRPDTNEAYFRVKAAVQKGSSDGEAQLLAMKRFVSDLKMDGRTLVEVQGDVEVSILNPQQYRPQVISLMAQDVESVTSALGEDYRVVLSGIDRPVKWARVGSTDVAIFIPYEYTVVPTSVSSLNMPPEY